MKKPVSTQRREVSADASIYHWPLGDEHEKPIMGDFNIILEGFAGGGATGSRRKPCSSHFVIGRE